MIRALIWFRSLIGLYERPLPPPPQVSTEDEMTRFDPDPKVCADALEANMEEVFAANGRAAMTSLQASQAAITAEERTRSVLDDLMRDMDRGQNSGNG